MNLRRYIAGKNVISGCYISIRGNGQLHFSYDLRRELKLKEGDQVCFFDDPADPKAWYLSLTDTAVQPRKIIKDPREALYCSYGALIKRWRDIFPLRKGTQQRMWVVVDKPLLDKGETYYRLEFRGS